MRRHCPEALRWGVGRCELLRRRGGEAVLGGSAEWVLERVRVGGAGKVVIRPPGHGQPRVTWLRLRLWLRLWLLSVCVACTC